MIRLFSFIAGFFLALACYSLAGTTSFICLAAVTAAALFLLFFVEVRGLAAWFVIGFCLAVESYGLAHFGLASALGFFLVLLHELLGLRLNFTSRFIRYMIALALALMAYAALLQAPEGLAQRLITLLAVYPVIGIAAYFFSSIRQKQTYELV